MKPIATECRRRLDATLAWRFPGLLNDDSSSEVADFIDEVLPQIEAGESVILRGYTAIHAAEVLGLPWPWHQPLSRRARPTLRQMQPGRSLKMGRVRTGFVCGVACEVEHVALIAGPAFGLLDSNGFAVVGITMNSLPLRRLAVFASFTLITPLVAQDEPTLV